jgi:hypothetical protein
MNKTLRTLAAIAAFTIASAAQLASADSSRDPVIIEVRANAANTVLQVTGANLSDRTPKLTLGAQARPLVITLLSPTRIDALLPAGISPGSYLLTLTTGKQKDGGNDSNEDRGDEFWVTLAAAGAAGKDGATGPAGPAGPAGVTGATGAMGPQGLTGPVGPAGATGPQGSNGAAGPVGATGPQGPAGPAGAIGPQGPSGTGGSLPSFDSLVGLPCNLANIPFACRGVIALELGAVDYNTGSNSVSLSCVAGRQPYFRFFLYGVGLAPDEEMTVSELASGTTYTIRHNLGGYTRIDGSLCREQVATIRIVRTRIADGAQPGGRDIALTGPGTCTGTVPVSGAGGNEVVMTCTFTMDSAGNYETVTLL